MTDPIPQIRQRPCHPAVYQQALVEGLSELQARVVSGRYQQPLTAVLSTVTPNLSVIAPPSLLLGMDKATGRLLQAINARQRIAIVTDYDVDGVTSHAVIYRALTQYFKVPENLVTSFIGHRLQDGYGLSAPLVERILQQQARPEVVITADCGSSDEVQIARLHAHGIDVVVTDHHGIPAEGAPISACAVINPTQELCSYPDDTIAGCMVAWLLMSQLRNALIAAKILPDSTPKLAAELDWVALGTIADCVSMGTAINRAVVRTGLQVMNGLQRPCWQVIAEALAKNGKPFDAEDLGFQIGPRINARSRMADPYAALQFVLAADNQTARQFYQILDEDNQSRKVAEQEMVERAKQIALQQIESGSMMPIVYLPDGHPGVQGIVAARIMQWTGCPALVLCPHQVEGQLTGSARSIPQIHVRDCLQQVADRQPGLLRKFGGHKGAAGLTIDRDALETLQTELNQVLAEQLQYPPQPVIWTDGQLQDAELCLATYQQLQNFAPWGREFEKPLFAGLFYVEQLKPVGKPALHLSLRLSTEDQQFKAIWFRVLAEEGQEPPIAQGDVVYCAYTLAEDIFQQQSKLQLIIEYASLDE